MKKMRRNVSFTVFHIKDKFIFCVYYYPHARGQGNNKFPCSADGEQDWQPYPVDPYSAICDDRTDCV